MRLFLTLGLMLVIYGRGAHADQYTYPGSIGPAGPAGSADNMGDANARTQNVIGVKAIIDASGCYVRYPDGTIQSTSGAWVSGGCDTNTPTTGQEVCFITTATSTNTIPHVGASGNVTYSGVYTNFIETRTCYIYDGTRWGQETVLAIPAGISLNGNIVNMSGSGTNIIAAGVTGCILTGTNNGILKISQGSDGNIIHANIAAGARIDIGTNSSYNIISAETFPAGGGNIRIQNDCRQNTFHVWIDSDGLFDVGNECIGNTITAYMGDGGPGPLNCTFSSITNCVVMAPSTGAGTTFTLSGEYGTVYGAAFSVANATATTNFFTGTQVVQTGVATSITNYYINGFQLAHH